MADEIWQWVTPEGPTYRLDSEIDGAAIIETVTGRGMPPIRRTAETVPLQPGSRPRSILHDEGEVSIGVSFHGSDPSALRAITRAWLNRLDPTKGAGILRVTGPAGDVRELACTYQDGLELEEPHARRNDQLTVISFVAPDPYWADDTDSSQAWTAGAASTFFPIFPIRLGASQVFGISTVTNGGDVPTYPVWVITGPGSQLKLTNLTTGRVLAWNGTLGGGEFIIIDCRPGNQTISPKSVIKNDGTNQFGALAQWDFWPFEPDANTIEIELTGATSASRVTAVWRRRYLGA